MEEVLNLSSFWIQGHNVEKVVIMPCKYGYAKWPVSKLMIMRNLHGIARTLNHSKFNYHKLCTVLNDMSSTSYKFSQNSCMTKIPAHLSLNVPMSNNYFYIWMVVQTLQDDADPGL